MLALYQEHGVDWSKCVKAFLGVRNLSNKHKLVGSKLVGGRVCVMRYRIDCACIGDESKCGVYGD